MEKQAVKVNNAFFRTTLRSSGYNTVRAIADIVDNSLEKKVNATEVHVFITIDKEKKIKEISIVDNGYGMDLETMNQCITLGSQTGKGEDTLGKYGIGSKSASLSYAQTVNIVSRPVNSKSKKTTAVFGVLDVTFPNGCMDLNAPIIQEAGVGDFKDIKSSAFRLWKTYEHGTIVITSNIDRLTTTDPYRLLEQIISEFGMIYRNDLNNRKLNLEVHVEGPEKIEASSSILSMDWTGESFGASELIGSGTIGKTNMTYRAYYVNDDVLLKKSQVINNRYVGRSSKYRGLFFVRNGRLLTDYGIDFDFITDSQSVASTASYGYNCFRCIIELTGEEDPLIGVTYTKILNGFSGITQPAKEAIIETLSPLVRQAKEMDDKKKVAFRMSDDGTKQMLKTLANLNKLLGSCKSFIDKLKGLTIRRRSVIISGEGDQFGFVKAEDEEEKTSKSEKHYGNGNSEASVSRDGDLLGGGKGKDRRSNNISGGLLSHIYEVNKGEKEPYVTFPEFGVVEINRDHKKYLNLMAVCDEGERQREIMNIAAGMYARKLVENEIGKPLDDVFEMYNQNLNNIEGKCLEVAKPYSDKKK